MVMLPVFTIAFLFIIRCRFPKLESLSEVVCFHYANHVLKFIRKFEKLNYRVQKVNIDAEFLKSFFENDLWPARLHYKMSSEPLQNSASYRRSQRLFLQEETSFRKVKRKILLGKCS